MEIQCCDPIELIQDLDFGAVWKHCCDLTRSPGKHTSVTRSRWINHHDLTVAIVTDHNDLNGFTAFLFEALNCNHTTAIKTLVKKQTVCPESERFSHPSCLEYIGRNPKNVSVEHNSSLHKIYREKCIHKCTKNKHLATKAT